MSENLTLQQKEAVENRGGKLLVSAAAGSGKTKVLVDRLMKYIMDPVSPCNIDDFLMITYTKAAAAELRGKIAAAIAQALSRQPENRHLQRQMNLAYVFISHDLSVVKFISDKIGVMYLGNMVETAPSDELFAHPLHPYTEALLNAIPTTVDESHRELQVLEGDIPSPVNPPAGCRFHTRCKYATERCATEVPLK